MTLDSLNTGRKGQSQGGSTLVITLVLSVVLIVFLGGYLSWVSTQCRLVTESQAWNSSLANAEAGIEEGLMQINIGAGNMSSLTAATNYGPSLATNWAGPSDGVYGPRTHAMVGGSYGVIVIPGTPGPTIISTGYAQVPLVAQPVARVVRVTTTTSAAFGNAIAAQLNITMSGNNITVDSYDSTDPNHSTNGFYNAATRMAGGDVASVGGIVTVQNANICGHLKTGPTGGYSIGANGSVGDLPANWPTQQGIEDGWYFDDFNMDFPDVVEPFSPNSGSSVSSSKSGGKTTYTIYGSGNYTMNSLNVGAGESLIIPSNVNAILYVTGNVSMTSQGNNASQILIQPGATLQLYVGGASAGITQVNTAGNASTFKYFGLPANTSVTWSGNSQYLGTLYAPQADVSLGGGGNNVYDFQGAMSIRSVTMNGHFNVHYDESLKRLSYLGGFIVNSWKEL